MIDVELSRLIFLAEELKPYLPDHIAKLIPVGSLIQTISKGGIGYAAAEGGLPLAQLQRLYDDGADISDLARLEEFRSTVSKLALKEIEEMKGEVELSVYLERMGAVRDYLTLGDDELVETVTTDFSQIEEVEPIEKWNSGFYPFDAVVKGFYQGIFTVMAKSGVGKTTYLLALMEALKLSGAASGVWFYEVEIPTTMMRYRMTPIIGRTKLDKRDKLVTGYFTIPQVLSEVLDNPDPNRVIIIDGPDAMSAAAGENRRYSLDAIYRDLIRLKNRTKAVFVSSQARRGENYLTSESVAESWGKTWYSDAVLGIHKAGHRGIMSEVMINCSKNRFGMAPLSFEFLFDYANFIWQPRAGSPVNQEAEEGDGAW